MGTAVLEEVSREHVLAVGETVFEQMKKAGFNYGSLASALGCSAGTVRNAIKPPENVNPNPTWRPKISEAIGWPATKFDTLINNPGMAQTALSFSHEPEPVKTVRPKKKAPSALSISPARQKKTPTSAPAANGVPVWTEPTIPELPVHYGPVRVGNAILLARVDALEEHIVRLTACMQEVHARLG